MNRGKVLAIKTIAEIALKELGYECSNLMVVESMLSSIVSIINGDPDLIAQWAADVMEIMEACPDHQLPAALSEMIKGYPE